MLFLEGFLLDMPGDILLQIVTFDRATMIYSSELSRWILTMRRLLEPLLLNSYPLSVFELSLCSQLILSCFLLASLIFIVLHQLPSEIQL